MSLAASNPQQEKADTPRRIVSANLTTSFEIVVALLPRPRPSLLVTGEARDAGHPAAQYDTHTYKAPGGRSIRLHLASSISFILWQDSTGIGRGVVCPGGQEPNLGGKDNVESARTPCYAWYRTT